MPNWCSNFLTVETTDGSSIESFYKANGGDNFSFLHSVPVPAGERGTDQWGTKWDVNDCEADMDETCCNYSFDTAWSPPIQWMETTSKLYPGLIFRLEAEEPGFDFRVKVHIQNGVKLLDHEENYYREATMMEAQEAIEDLGLNDVLCPSSQVDEVLADHENALEEYPWSHDLPLLVESLTYEVRKLLIAAAKRRGRERVGDLFYAVIMLKKFARRYVAYTNAPGGAVYEKTRARFEAMANKRRKTKK
jgi:hypothetical protein